MRICISLALALALALPARADTLRVGSRVLATGDSAAKVLELLGKPAHKAGGAKAAKATGKRGKNSKKGKRDHVGAADASAGERWQYRRNGRTVTVVLVDGRVTRIE